MTIGARDNVHMSRIQLTRWFVNSIVVLGVLMIGGVAALFFALHLYQGAECMTLIGLAVFIQAALYLSKEKDFAND